MQQAYYTFLQSRRTDQRQPNLVTTAIKTIANKLVMKVYFQVILFVSQFWDGYLVCTPLEHLARKAMDFKQEWARNTQLNILAHQHNLEQGWKMSA